MTKKQIVEKPKMGAPTKYKPEYCAQLEQHMADGYSFESFAGKTGTNVDTLYNWEKSNKDFSEAKRNGNANRLLKHEEMLQDIASGRIQGNASAMIFKMKNLGSGLGWRDQPKEDLQQNKGIQITFGKAKDVTLAEVMGE